MKPQNYIFNSIYSDGYKTITFISPEHLKIHQGKMFNIFGNISLNNDQTKILSAYTNDVEVHFSFFLHCTDDFTIGFFEGGEITEGNIIQPINNNRILNSPSNLIIFEDPTVISIGDKLFEVSLYGSQSINPSTTRYNEFVLKPFTTYIFIITAGSNGTKIFYKLDWYEN